VPATPQAAPAEPVAAEAATTAGPEAAAPDGPAAAPARAIAAEPAAPAPSAAAAGAPLGPAPSPVSTPLSGHLAGRAAPLHRAPAAVATLLHVAAERGITRAKMALKPAELGGIEIRLQASAAGIAAQVVADSPEAAKLLAQAGDDLRRALEARDVTLISLEVSTSGDERREGARGEWSDADDAPFSSSDRSTGDADAEPPPTSHSVLELPGGLLVDVLA
jgi:flagellar hook-length control protein FliK